MSTSAAARPQENVWDYPRPPALEETPLRLRVVWNAGQTDEVVLADTTKGYRVLETSHPPTYYLPPGDVKTDLFEKTSRSSFCEWKGQASYYSFKTPGGAIQNRIWTYTSPTKGTKFGPIKDYISFYASSNTSPAQGKWTCFVEEEEVIPQEGDFYGGWKTKEIVGKMKGGPGTWGW